MWEEDELPLRSRYDAVGVYVVVQSRRVCVSVSLRPSASRERSSRIPPFKCSDNFSSRCVFRKEFELTECFEEVLPAFDPHPPIRGVWVDHGMVYLDAFPIRLLVPGEILQSLPGACPGQAGHDDIIHACDVPSWNVRHREYCPAPLSTAMQKLNNENGPEWLLQRPEEGGGIACPYMESHM